jgi:hypothetical protein
MDNFGKRFFRACKHAAGTTALGACVICGAVVGTLAAAGAAAPQPVPHFKIVQSPEISLSSLFRNYGDQREDYHYDGAYEPKDAESAPIMGTAALPDRPPSW